MDPRRSLEALKRLRDERGIKPEALRRSREARQTWKALREAFQAGAQSIPELAAATGLPTQLVLWHVNAMRRYGEVEIAGEAESYLRYRLVAGASRPDAD